MKEIQVQRRYNSVSKTQELQNKMIQKGTVEHMNKVKAFFNCLVALHYADLANGLR